MENRVPGPGLQASLLGRSGECALLDGLLSDIRQGQSRALVLRGEAGIGKTALLEEMCKRADGLLLVRGGGIECEAELAFAGLQHMCSQMVEEKLDLLPDPQREAIRRAFGQSADGPPDPFLLGLGVLNRLSDVAADQPVLCVVDDAQWLDRASAQTLAFVARRLDAEAVGVVFAVRERIEQLDGLPELVVSGLGPDDAHQLLGSVLTAPLDNAVCERFIDETRGNPLALLELPRELSAAELAGGFGIQETIGVPTRVEESFQRRCEELPDETCLLMLIAAAEPIGDPVLLWRAASVLGVAPAAAEPAEAAGLLKLGMRIMFRHPLVRSAVYRMAAPHERRRVHRALATATDPNLDPDRRAWHAANGASGPDENIAAALERSAGRAQTRGGLAAAAAFLARAVELSPEATARGERALDAAEAKYLAGSPEDALRLVAIAERGPINEVRRTRIAALRGRVATMQRRAGDAPPLLLDAARRLERLDPGVARDTYRDAFIAAIYAGRFSGETGLAEVAAAVRSAAPSTQPPGATDELLDAAALLIDGGWAAGVERVRRALADFGVAPISQAVDLHWLFLACRMAQYVWDEDAWDALGRRILERVRDSGVLSLLPMALAVRVGWELFAGDLATASALVVEQDTVQEAIGGERSPGSRIVLAAYRGREAEVARLDEATTRGAVARGDGPWVSLLHWSTAVLYNGLGRYDEALAHAQLGTAYPPDLSVSSWTLSELVEAAARCGRPEAAADALGRLAEMAHACGTDWVLGVEARARAAVADAAGADALHRHAIECLERTRFRTELARTHLLYGEWLRRAGRRVDARAQLRVAHDQFTSIGMGAFAERARKELLATGEKARKRTVETRDDLTAQERQIADLARNGLANPEIGARLFLSPRTVEWHLHKVFGKLGIRSRHELANALARSDSEPEQAQAHAPEFASTTRLPR
jgi:DNA-binding CsgD family transcriptional regulator/tetratricopeptide (TPR) repeat protein